MNEVMKEYTGYIPVGQKYCYVCDQLMGISFFYDDGSMPDGKQQICCNCSDKGHDASLYSFSASTISYVREKITRVCRACNGLYKCVPTSRHLMCGSCRGKHNRDNKRVKHFNMGDIPLHNIFINPRGKYDTVLLNTEYGLEKYKWDDKESAWHCVG